jgi:hypothetical protein
MVRPTDFGSMDKFGPSKTSTGLYTEGRPLFPGGPKTDYYTPREQMDPTYREKVFPKK